MRRPLPIGRSTPLMRRDRLPVCAKRGSPLEPATSTRGMLLVLGRCGYPAAGDTLHREFPDGCKPPSFQRDDPALDRELHQGREIMDLELLHHPRAVGFDGLR